MKAERHFRVLASPHIRTYSNKMADVITRADEDQVDRRMQAAGFTKVDIHKTWVEILACGHERRVHSVALVGPEERQVAV